MKIIMSEQVGSQIGLVSQILSFLGGCLSFAAGSRLYRSNLSQIIRIWQLKRKLNKAMDKNDQKRIKELESLLPVLKLYSSKVIDQGTAIRQIAEFENESAFALLSSRLGSKPELSEEIKAILLITLRDVAINLKGN